MRICLLGSLTTLAGGSDLLPSADKPRQIFALLALNPNRVVPVQTLMDELWGEHPPRTATTTLQTYILQLRKGIKSVLGGTARPRDVLVTRYNGYLLNVPPGSRDIDDFQSLREEARVAAGHGDDETAYDCYTQALSLWRGPALVDLPQGRALEPEVVSLTAARLNAVEARVAAGLRLNLHHEIMAELMLEAARHPMNQNLHAQLILAQHRAGRTSDALATYKRLHVSMVDELGLEPSPWLRDLRQAVITTSPVLDDPGTTTRVLGNPGASPNDSRDQRRRQSTGAGRPRCWESAREPSAGTPPNDHSTSSHGGVSISSTKPSAPK